MHKKRILILGEYGNFGRRICTALSRLPEVECLLGSPHPWRGVHLARELGVAFKTVDVTNRPLLRQALDGIYAVVNTCGPFQGRDYTVAEQCADRGIHYVDPADSREYVRGMAKLSRRAEESGCLVVSGAGAVPTLSAMLVDMIAGEFDSIQEIHTSLAPGSDDQRHLATLRAILGYRGAFLRTRSRSGNLKGWTRPVSVAFPPPIGRRRVFPCDVPDLDIFPRRYGAGTVTFRAGLPSTTINLSLFLLAGLRKRGRIRSMPPPAEFLLRRAHLFQGQGAVSSGLRVSVVGQKGSESINRVVSLVARDGNGPAIQAAATIALIRKWATQGVPHAGMMPCVDLLNIDDIKVELRGYDIVMVRS